MKKSEYMQLWETFYKTFWRNINWFVEMLGTEPELDIFKFEEFLIEKGYDEEKESMSEFVKKTYGEDAEKFVYYLLN